MNFLKGTFSVKKIYPILLGLFSGILLSIAYRVPGFWPLSFIALIPLLEAVFQAGHLSHQRSSYGHYELRDVFIAGSLAGFCVIGTSIMWVFSADALPNAVGISSIFAQFTFIGLTWLLTTLVMGILVGFWAVLVRCLKPRYILDAGAVAALWVAAEYARMYSYNLLTLSSTIHNQPFFSTGFIAYPLMDSDSWRQLASLGGIAFLGFLVVLINVFFYECLQIKNRKKRILWTGVLVALILAITFAPLISIREHFSSQHPGTQLKIAVLSVATPVPGSEVTIETYQNQAVGFASSAIAQGANAVLLPEDSRFINLGLPEISKIIGSSNAVIIDTSPITQPDGTRPAESFAETTHGVALIRDKAVFTPQGEYIPSLFQIFLMAIGESKALETFNVDRNFAQGNVNSPAALDGIHASLLFCLEVLTPDFGKQLVTGQGSKLLLVPSSDSTFDYSPSLRQDVLRWNQSQAVTAGVPVAESDDLGPGFVLDKYGRIVTEVGKNGVPGFTIVSLSL
jgi:apolipoprotein N-acyltransferase